MDSGNTIFFRKKQRTVNLWRSSSFSSFTRLRGSNSSMLKIPRDKLKKFKQTWTTVVTIVLVEAKCSTLVPNDGISHSVYCKFILGPEKFKSKSVASSHLPKWKERFQFHLYEDYNLNIFLYGKGKMKNSMGSCTIDLSLFEKERTHDIWEVLSDGFGAIHISVTMCTIRNIATLNKTIEGKECSEDHSINKVPKDWDVVGLLHVKVIGAKGFISKPNAYCTLEIDNQRVETHRSGASIDPTWNKCYVFKVYDVSSTLDLKVYDSSIGVLNESIGKVSIPLLRISNGITRWYALKDRHKRSNARGNCPRILLQMSLVFDPIKATIKLFQPKEVKYITKRPAILDIPIIYKNMKYISDLLSITEEVNEYYKRLLEWDDRDFSFFVLVFWLIICFNLSLWLLPLLLILPYAYNGIFNRQRDTTYKQSYTNDESKSKEETSISGKIQEIHKMAFTIIDGIEFIVSHIERLQSLITFKVPFLSYVSILFLVAASAVLYLVPFNYIIMGLGLYKFTRKYLNPNRTSNNDFIDFLSRVPDCEILKDWKELGVPEPNQELKEHTSTSTITITSL